MRPWTNTHPLPSTHVCPVTCLRKYLRLNILIFGALRQRQWRIAGNASGSTVDRLAGEYIGLEEIDDGIWNVYFGPLKNGRLHERATSAIEDEYGKLKRHNV